MRLKGIIDEDFVQYKIPSMFLITPFCDFKCDLLARKPVCQNSALENVDTVNINDNDLINRYLKNDISKSIVIGGMEPFYYDYFYTDLLPFIKKFRLFRDDMIVIYTGYYHEEIKKEISELSNIRNIIVKFGRFIPDSVSKFDDVLGVNLSSVNQYAIQIN